MYYILAKRFDNFNIFLFFYLELFFKKIKQAKRATVTVIFLSLYSIFFKGCFYC